jgi:inhibitor of cysteine peptidase
MFLVIAAVVSAAGCGGKTKLTGNEIQGTPEQVTPASAETPAVTSENVTENNTTQFNTTVETKQVVTQDDNGKNISLKTGETFCLKLWENPAITGYSWELNLSKGLSILSEHYTNEQTSPEMIDGPLTHSLIIKGITSGSQQVKGIYKHTLENATGTEKNLTINVEVV